jgi:import inner membrane translocase subunit TIM22
MKNRGVSSGKNFMIVGALFTLSECALEKLRGKKDMKNAIMSGFMTGALLSARAGPTAMIMGGSGFAAFSVIIELVSPMLFDH